MKRTNFAVFRVASDHNQAVVDALSSQIVLSGKFTDEHVISGKIIQSHSIMNWQWL